MQLPDKINILGTPYRITYVDKASEVDKDGESVYWGQIDYWGCKIRVWKGDRPVIEVWKTLLHEILHGIANTVNIDCLKDKENHEDLDLLSETLIDVLVRNNLLEIEED